MSITNIIEVSTSPMYEIADIKAALNIQFDDQDAIIGAAIIGVTSHIEKLTGKCLSVTKYIQFQDKFNDHNYLSQYPLGSGTPMVKYYNKDNELTDLDTTEYNVVKSDKTRGFIWSLNPFPETYNRPDAVQIEYWAATDTIDADIFWLVCTMVKVLFDNPTGSQQKDLLTVFDRLIMPNLGGSGL